MAGGVAALLLVSGPEVDGSFVDALPAAIEFGALRFLIGVVVGYALGIPLGWFLEDVFGEAVKKYQSPLQSSLHERPPDPKTRQNG